MNSKGILSVALISFYFIIGVATSQAPRHIISAEPMSPVNINNSKHILYFENFNSNKRNWPEGQYDSVEYYFDHGHYVFNNKGFNELAIQNVYPEKAIIESKDWIYEASFSIKSQNENGTTYILWGKNGLDFEAYGFAQKDGKSFIWQGHRVAGKWEGSTTAVNHYTKNNQSIQLSIHRVNDRLDFYLNKRLKFSKPLTAFAGNEWAIAVEGNTQVSFDQITLKQLQFLEESKTYSTDRSKASFNEENKELVPVRKVGDRYLIPVYINETFSAQFSHDPWAASVIVSEGFAERLIKSGTLKDWIGDEGYQFENGTKVTSSRFMLRSIKVGTRTAQNVECMIVSTATSDMLIGTAVLSQLGTFVLDKEHQVLYFEE